MYFTTLSSSIDGIKSRPVSVEADVTDGLPIFTLVGYLASETREASERVRSALRNSGFTLGPRHITVNLAPASLKKDGSSFDLAIAVALLGGYGLFSQDRLSHILFLGELGLSGELCAIRGILEMVSHAAEQGCDTVIVPRQNLKEASVVKNVTVYGAADLNQIIHFLLEKENRGPYQSPDVSYTPPRLNPAPLERVDIDIRALYEHPPSGGDLDFSQIRGQLLLRRACEIAVAGLHNLLMIGPPGAGKSMAAKRIPTILPRTTPEEALEITKLHSIAGVLPEDTSLITTRPFRSPHHTITAPALCGGGSPPHPGEISLAHHGVLYLDELPEFDPRVIETLRSPLEDGEIHITRTHGSFVFPARFMLVASMNPCRCGFYPDRAKCSCTNAQIRRYLTHVSMPMLDRIDLGVEARKVSYDELRSQEEGESSEAIRRRVEAAAAIQQERYRAEPFSFNSALTADGVRRYCPLDSAGEKLMKKVYGSMNLTARSYTRILKVARTIADLDGSEDIRTRHLMEAVSYRAVDRKYWESAAKGCG